MVNKPHVKILAPVKVVIGGHGVAYDKKLEILKQKGEVSFTPAEFVLYLLEQHNINLLRFNRKLGYGDTYFETNIFNTSAGNGRSHKLPKPFVEKLTALTSTDADFWLDSTSISSNMVKVIDIDMEKDIRPVIGKYAHLSQKSHKSADPDFF